MIHELMVHNKRTTKSTMKWIPLCGAYFIVHCDSALIVHNDYFEHFPFNKKIFYYTLSGFLFELSWNMQTLTRDSGTHPLWRRSALPKSLP
jgi:hypothetical protein